MSDSVRPHRWQPTRLLCPWDSPGKNAGVGCHFLLQCVKVKSESEVAQSCPTLRDPMDCSLPGSSIHGICQARILEWGASAFSVTLTRMAIIKKTDKITKKETGPSYIDVLTYYLIISGIGKSIRTEKWTSSYSDPESWRERLLTGVGVLCHETKMS